MAASPLPSRGSEIRRNCNVTLAFSGIPRRRDKIRNGYIIHAFSGARIGENCYVTPSFSGVPREADKIGGGYSSPAFLGANKWAALLHNAYFLGSPQKRARNQN